MKKNNFIRFIQSLIILPVMAMPAVIPVSNFGISQFNIKADGTIAFNKTVDPEVALQEARMKKASSIDAYFKDHDMPLEGTGMTMVLASEKNDIDWRLLAAISVRESTGGKHACKKVKFSSFGWGSCKIGFNSNEEAIETVARNLGGNNPKTSHYYDGKTTKQILQKYNPPSIVARYADQVISIMNDIGEEDIVETTVVVNM